MKVNRKSLIKAQQGELDAVPMYLKLSEIARDIELKETLKKLAADEGRHASVFYKLTNQELKPKMLKATVLPVLQKILGWKFLLRIISKAEYSAYKKYEPTVAAYPETESVRDDEKRHGDILKKFTV